MGKGIDTIEIDSVFHSPVEMVWKAWTEPSLVLKWFGSDPGGKGLRAEMDVRIGGYYEISFCDSDFTEHTCSGIYRIVEINRHLAFNWSWKSEPGVESQVEVLFSGQGQFTNMHFSHSNVGHASMHNYLEGWLDTFRKLEQVLSQM
jgi:uncharacterized protein YndB with AHSA1/START domain